MRYRLGEFELDTQRELLIGPAGASGLRPQAWRLLRYLVERAPALVSRDELMDALWGHHALSPNVIPQTISELRQALGDDSQQPRFIETRHRRGYAFIATVEVIAEPTATALAPTAGAGETSAELDPGLCAASVPEQSTTDLPTETVSPIPTTTRRAVWFGWLAVVVLLISLLAWTGRSPDRSPEPATMQIAATRFALRLSSAPPPLGAYLGMLARSSSEWVLHAPETSAAPSAWTLDIAANGKWRLHDAHGQERSNGTLPQADVPSQAQTLLRALEAPTGRTGLARDPLGWPAALEGRQALVDAALATADQRHGDANADHARAAKWLDGPGWPTLLRAEALARSGDWRAAAVHLSTLHGKADRALALQADILRARLRTRPAELLAAQRAYTLLLPEAIDARLDVLDLQLAQAQWSAAADSLEALAAELGENAPALAWRRAQWLGAMQPSDAPTAYAWAMQRAREASDSISLRRAQLALAEWQLRRSQLVGASAAMEGLDDDDPQTRELRAQLAMEQGELETARGHLAYADSVWRGRGLLGEARRVRLGLVEVALRAGEHANAVTLAEVLVVEAADSGDTRLDGDLLEALGRAQTGLGQLEQARERLQRAIDLSRDSGDLAREARARYHLGNLHAHERRPHEAEQAYRLSAEAYRSLRQDRGEAMALANLALMAERSGRRLDAREAYRDALSKLRDLGIPREIGRVTFNLGVNERDLGDLAQAAAHFDDAAVELDQAGAVDIRLMVGAARADLAISQGDPVSARAALEAVDLLRSKATWVPQSAWLTASARLNALADRRDQARQLLNQAREVRSRPAVRVAMLDVELRLLRLELDSPSSAQAARVGIEAIESELLRLGEAGYALGASLAATEAAWSAGDAAAAYRRAQDLRVPVQSRGTRAQQLQLEWLLALAGEDSLRRERLQALEQAAAKDGFHLLERLARRELLTANAPERAEFDRQLANDGFAGAMRTPVAEF